VLFARGIASDIGNIGRCCWGGVADDNLFEVVLEFSAPAGVAQLTESLGFNLPDELPGYPELSAYLFQRAASAVYKPKPQFEYAPLSRSERIQDSGYLLLQ